MNDHTIPPLPTPTVDNLRKANPQQLADEVVNLRLYVASLHTEIKYLKQVLDDATGQAPQRLLELEQRQTQLGQRVRALEEGKRG